MYFVALSVGLRPQPDANAVWEATAWKSLGTPGFTQHIAHGNTFHSTFLHTFFPPGLAKGNLLLSISTN